MYFKVSMYRYEHISSFLSIQQIFNTLSDTLEQKKKKRCMIHFLEICVGLHLNKTYSIHLTKILNGIIMRRKLWLGLGSHNLQSMVARNRII